MERHKETKEQEEDVASSFSYAKSDNLNLSLAEMDTMSEHAKPESIYSDSTPSTKSHTTNTIDQSMISENSKSGSGSGFTSNGTPNSNKEIKGFGPPVMLGKRSSMVSQLSDYSAKGNHIAQPVSVKVVNQDVNPTVSRKYYRFDERDDEQDVEGGEEQDQAESVNTIPDDAIKLGKLKTKPGITSEKLEPDMTFNTNVESSVPPRSSRRPKSEVLTTTNELDKDIEKFNKNKVKAHNKRSSIAISEDLDKLMESANSITLQFYVYKTVDDKIKYHERKPLSQKEQEEKEAEYLDETVGTAQSNQDAGHSSNSFLSRAVSNRTTDSYRTADIMGPDPMSDNRLPKASLPPRPTADNVQRARQVSNQISEQQMQVQDPLPASGTAQSPRGTPIASPKDDDEYYDIDEPIVLEKPARGKSVKDSTRSMKKVKHKKAKSKHVRSLSTPGLRPFSYHTLINLLESTNGTIIGEEFDQLNLPIKEKQLIEKIVDSLSRLTSDMVLDENRYDIGIARLEKAHRALEGFI